MQKSPWLRLVYLTIAYTLLVLVAAVVLSTIQRTGVLYILAVISPFLLLSGAWSVLGPGSYVVRTFVSFSAVMIMLVLPIMALSLMYPLGGIVFGSGLNPFEQFFVFACYGIPFVVAAQIPYWIFRLSLGWQLGVASDDLEEMPKAKKIDIKEMLAVTAVFAVVLAAPSRATSYLSNRYINDVEIGDIGYETEVDEKTGDLTPIETRVTEENLVAHQQERATYMKSASQSGQWIVLGCAAAIAVTSLVNVPCFYIGMKVSDKYRGFQLAALYWLAIFLVGFLIPALLGRQTGSVLAEIAFYFSLWAILFAIAAALPMLIVRQWGGQLLSQRDFQVKA
jgi:hypothetical protein